MLSRVIEQGLSFVSLAVVEVMTLLGDVGDGNNSHRQIETAPRGVDVLRALFLDFVGDCLQNRVDVAVPLNVTLIVALAGDWHVDVRTAVAATARGGGSASGGRGACRGRPGRGDSSPAAGLRAVRVAGECDFRDASLQQTLTERILRRYQSYLLINGALEAAAKWERELVLRCGLAEMQSEAIDRVILRIRSSPSDFIRRGTQIRYLLEDVKESVSNYEVLECLLRFAAVGKEVEWERRRRAMPMQTWLVCCCF